MKKIITKISLKPLLTLFLKKKTVRRTPDIAVQKPKRKLRPMQTAQLNDAQLSAAAWHVINSIQGRRDYPVPVPSIEELNVLMADFEFAMLEYRQSQTRQTLDHLNKLRQAVRDCLRFLKIKQSV